MFDTIFGFVFILIGLCGAVLGVVLALVLATLVNQSGLDWLPPGNAEPLTLTITVLGETRIIRHHHRFDRDRRAVSLVASLPGC